MCCGARGRVGRARFVAEGGGREEGGRAGGRGRGRLGSLTLRVTFMRFSQMPTMHFV